MNNLDRAKELREDYYFKPANPCSVRICHLDIPIKAKQLKEKVEKGCGNVISKDVFCDCIEVSGIKSGLDPVYGIGITELEAKSGCYAEYKLYRSVKNKASHLWERFCKECQETLKILNEILGEGE